MSLWVLTHGHLHFLAPLTSHCGNLLIIDHNEGPPKEIKHGLDFFIVSFEVTGCYFCPVLMRNQYIHVTLMGDELHNALTVSR